MSGRIYRTNQPTALPMAVMFRMIPMMVVTAMITSVAETDVQPHWRRATDPDRRRRINNPWRHHDRGRVHINRAWRNRWRGVDHRGWVMINRRGRHGVRHDMAGY